MKLSDQQSYKMKISDNPEDFVKDLIVVPKSHRRMSGSYDPEMQFNLSDQRSRRKSSVIGPIVAHRIRNLSFDEQA